METGLPDIGRFLEKHYNLEELKALCFDLDAKYDDLAGTTLPVKARELVLWAGRQRKLDQLLAAMRDTRRAPFDRAGLRAEPSEVEGLYRDLAAFESSTAPQSGWTRFRRRPWAFYPSLAFVIIMALVLLVSGLVSIAGGMEGVQRQLQKWGLLGRLILPPQMKPWLLLPPSMKRERRSAPGPNRRSAMLSRQRRQRQA